MLPKKDIQNKGKRLLFFFFFHVTSRVSTLGKVKARTHPKAFPRSPLSLSTIERERSERSKRTVN